MIQHLSFTFIPFFAFATQLFSTPVTSLNLRNQALLFTELCLLQATDISYAGSQSVLGSYANAGRFGSQLYDVRFGSSCCTSIQTFPFIFSVLFYVWVSGLAVRFRG